MTQGVLRVLSSDELSEQQVSEDAAYAESQRPPEPDIAAAALGNYIRSQYEAFKRHRTHSNIDRELLASLRAYNGNYDPQKIAEIQRFGGSKVFARITSTKCRGATALLRDVYMGGERPWTMTATPEPDVPGSVMEDIEQLVAVEAQQLAMMGQPVPVDQIEARRRELFNAAKLAAKKTADQDAKRAAHRIEDILVEGKFYTALKEFLADLPIFKFACIKGPEVKNVVQVTWRDGQLVQERVPKMFWRRVSPFDLYITPGVSSGSDGAIIERMKLQRSDLQQCIGLPGYNEENIRAVLEAYEHGLYDWLDTVDSERAEEEDKENPHWNESGLIDTLEYHGPVRGKWLREYGFTEDQVPDPDLDYSVVAWVIGRFTIKVHINPNPKQRHPYYMTSFEKIPGSVYGHSIPEIIEDLQDVANAAFRSLVNNMSISSGPQVMINEDRLSPTTNGDTLYPWKRWRFVNDPLSNTTGAERPIDFFQPQSNAQELLGVYQKMADVADEVSAIPRYITGNEKIGGAASTASGLSMLMNNVAKVLQNVAANIDEEVLQPALEDLYTMILLTSPDPFFKGDARVMVRGVAVAMQKETERMRKLELLQLTANPMDFNIIGEKGRAAILRDIAEDLGMDGVTIVPSEDDLDAQIEARQALQASQLEAAAQAQGGQPPMARNNGAGHAGEEFDNQFRSET